MVLPYYQQLENRDRTLGIKLENDYGKTETVHFKLLASYITPLGDIASVTSSHKENNFVYKIIRGWDFIGDNLYNHDFLEYQPVPRIVVATDEDLEDYINRYKNYTPTREDYIKVEDSNNPIYVPLSVFRSIQTSNKALTSIDKYKLELDRLYLKMLSLKKANIVNSFDIVDYYNFTGAFRWHDSFIKGKRVPYEDYSEEVRENIIGLISGQIAIYDAFLQLKRYVTKEQCEDLRKSLKDNNDFLVSLVSFDKVETVLPRTITTSKVNINETFFNYLIMDWKIYNIPKLVIDKEKGCIKKVDCTFLSEAFSERKYAEEIELIKEYVPWHERPKYFR